MLCISVVRYVDLFCRMKKFTQYALQKMISP